MSKKNDPQLKDIEKDIKKYAKIAEVASLEGGKELIDKLGKEILGSIEELQNKYRSASHIDLIVIISRLKASLDIYRDLIKAEGNKLEEKERYNDRLKELIDS